MISRAGEKRFQVYGRARFRDRSVKVYVGTFATQRDAEQADEEHRVTQRRIKAGDLPPAVDSKRTLGDGLEAWLRAIADQRSHDEYESRMRLYVRPTFDRRPPIFDSVLTVLREMKLAKGENTLLWPGMKSDAHGLRETSRRSSARSRRR